MRCLTLFCIWSVAAIGFHAIAADTAVPAKPPKFVLSLTLNEFSIFNVSEMDGLLKYGGSGEFRVTMARVGTNDVVWTVTIENPRLMELLGVFLGEKTMKLVQSLDPDNLDPNQKLALTAVKSLTQKLEEAQKNPVWDSIKMAGMIVQQGGDWVIRSNQGTFKLAGAKLEELKTRNGKPVVADGFVKVPGQFEPTRFLDQKTNTLEVFVMSLCPFGQRAETTVYNFLAQANRNPQPNVEIRYLFYKQKREEKDVFTSLHGEEELIENLVQIVIRDQFTGYFEPYVRLRAGSGRLPWQKLAEQAGIAMDGISGIESTITSQRESLMQREYDYATGQYEIHDGSPTYVWESERVTDLHKVEAFKGMAAGSSEACGQ